MCKLNGVLEDISGEIGFTATSTLVAWFGGSNLYVPATANEEHQIAQLIGITAFQHLVRAFGSETIWLPEGRQDEIDRRDRLITQCFREGLGAKVISERTGMSQRRINQIRVQLETRGLLPLILRENPRKYAP